MPPFPEVLIVGRPNVGKSTLFNRLVGKSLALVDNQPGSTRDLKSFDILWNHVTFTVTDSGGWVPGEKESIALKVGEMLEKKIRKVAALFMVVDGIEGITPADEHLVRYIRKYGIPTYLLVNKSDQPEKRQEILSDFLGLGFEKTYAISATHGLGVDDFLDYLTEELKKTFPQPTPSIKVEEPTVPVEGTEDAIPEKKPIRLAVLGKPNVGKSSLVNAILGEKRLIVDDMPGTTHDAIPVIIETDEDSLVMVDTAGIRASKNQDSNIETLSVKQALFELQTCQVVLLLIDGEKGVTHQDVTISRIISEAFRPVVIVINKWDIHPKAAEQARAERIAKRELRLIHFAPVLFISAKTGLNLDKVLQTAHEVFEESCREIPTRKFNLALQEAITKQPPPFKMGHSVKFLYGYQRTGHPPAFEIFVNHPESITPSYLRFLEVELRKGLDMNSTPLQLVLKARAEKREFKRKTYKKNFNLSAHKNKRSATKKAKRQKDG